MFRLDTPIASASNSDFDDIGTIISHSSLTGSKKAASWQQYIREDGHVFYVELSQAAKQRQTLTTKGKTDTSSLCSLCSTRSCHSCASEDTGYSSDADAHSNSTKSRRKRKLVKPDFDLHLKDRFDLDLSNDSLPHSRVTDFDDLDYDDDDGVSVDLLDLDRSDQQLPHVIAEQDFDDGDLLCSRLTNDCSINRSMRSLQPRTRHLGCTRTSSLCERHSNKLCVQDDNHRILPPHTDLSGEQQACRCGGQTSAMSQPKPATSDTRKEVVLHLRPTGHVWDGGSGVTWLESMLGIVPGRSDFIPGRNDLVSGRCDGVAREQEEMRERVVVKGLTHDGPAAKSKELFAGDYLYSINGRQLTWRNLDHILSSLHQTRKVRLMVQRPHTQLSSQFPSQPSSSVSSDRLVLDTNGILGVLQTSLSTPPTPRRGRRREEESLAGVCVLFMSMKGVTESSGQKDDVVYQFPKDDSVLTKLRGSFFTLDHLLNDSSDLDVRMLNIDAGDSSVNVACRKEGKDMLIVTVPADRLHQPQLLTVTNSVVRLIRLLFGSLEEAFSSEHHHGSLDEFLAFLFTTLQPSFKGTNNSLQPSLTGYMDYLPLPDDVLVSISNTLTEYESADFEDMSDSFYGCRRGFTILGSMMVYKGRTTCCHLNPDDAFDVGLYLRHSGLLSLSASHSLHQLLIWREIFPTRLCHEVAGINNVFGYSEPHARWYLLVVGVKNTLLACILEAGGCSTQFDGVRLPDPFFVDQARAAVVQLQTTDIISACEIRLSGDGLPATTSAQQLLCRHAPFDSNHRGLDSFLKNTAFLALGQPNNGHVALSNVSSYSGYGANLKGGRQQEWRKGSIDSDNSAGSGDALFKNNGSKGRLYPLAQKLPPAIVVDSDVNTCKLTAGKDNTLMAFCQVNDHEGVLITSPSVTNRDMLAGGLQKQVMDNFCRCASQIHAHFSRTSNVKVYPSEGVLEDIHGETSFSSCREEGVLFSCNVPDRTDSKKSPQTLVYWVVGRKFKNLHAREVYVCFHESAPQNAVELAFRISLGSMACV